MKNPRFLITSIAILLLAGPVNAYSDGLPASSEDKLSNSIVVVEFILCESVEEREPVNPVDSLISTDLERIYAFARVANSGEETELFFRWVHDEADYARIGVKVGTSPAWRTYTTVQTLQGDWTVELVDGSGEVLASADFHVKGTPEEENE